MDRLEHAGKVALRIEVGPSWEAEGTLKRAAEVGEDVAEEITTNDDVQRIGGCNKAGGKRVYVAFRQLHVGVLGTSSFVGAPVRRRNALRVRCLAW